MSEDGEIYKEVLARVIFPPTPKFSEVCPCIDCMKKINLLNEFEQEIRLKWILVGHVAGQMYSYRQTCINYFEAADWTSCFLDMLQINLKIVYKKSGVPSPLKKSKSEEELRDIHHQMAKLVTDNRLIKLGEAEYDQTDNILPLEDMIESGFFYYESTKFKDETLSILKAIEKIENEHEEDKKSAGLDKPLDPSISKRYIEDQIELIKKLPLNQLHFECQKLVDKIISIGVDKHNRMYSEATDAIDNTYYAMIKIRRAFWHRYALSDPLTSNDDEEKHNLSGLEETLESLCNQADLFRGLWKNNYAPYFVPFDRSDTKRQKT